MAPCRSTTRHRWSARSLAGGTLDGVAASSQTGTVVIDNTVTLQNASESLVEGAGATTRLTGAISGAGTLAVTGQVQLATTANTASVSVVANDAMLAIDTANAQGASGIQTDAGSTNTISPYDGAAPVKTTYVTNSGDDTIAAGSMLAVQENGNDTTLFGSGLATVFGGTGMNAYDFVKGVSGGNDVISGFKVGQDQIALFGYGSGTSGVAPKLVREVRQTSCSPTARGSCCSVSAA